MNRALNSLRAFGLAIAISWVAPVSAETMAKATFAGGCFWCVEEAFDKVEGVTETVSGYANGHVDNPSYKQVVRGGTGHVEALQVTYDRSRVSYERLLETFWANVDPLDDGGQFCDRGASYTTGIFHHNEVQRQLAEQSRQQLSERYDLPSSIVTPIEPLESFYPAEQYHQNYHQKNSVRYNYYVWRCGRHDRLEELWGDAEGDHLSLFTNES